VLRFCQPRCSKKRQRYQLASAPLRKVIDPRGGPILMCVEQTDTSALAVGRRGTPASEWRLR
jgi:hypothetical protein